MINSRRGSAGFHFCSGTVGGRGTRVPRGVRGDRGGVVRVVIGVAAAIGLVGCSSQEPAMPVPEEQSATVTIGADLTNPEHIVLAQLYAQSFATNGRDSEIVGIDDPDNRINAVRSKQVLVSFGCTGELLGLSDPAAAVSLAEEYQADTSPDKEQSPQWRDRVYEALSKSLPGEVMATDAGISQGCKETSASNPGSSLPQWLVPFYVKPALVRADRVSVLNEIAGSLSTEDLQTMTQAVLRGESAEDVARRWLGHSE